MYYCSDQKEMHVCNIVFSPFSGCLKYSEYDAVKLILTKQFFYHHVFLIFTGYETTVFNFTLKMYTNLK